MVILGIGITGSAPAQPSVPIESYRCQIYNIYTTGNSTGWLQVLKAMEASYNKSQNDDLQLEIIRTYYGYIPLAISKNNDELASKMLDRAFAYLDSFLVKHPKNAEAIAIRSSFYGYRIAINPLKGPFLGPRSQVILKEALAIAPTNPWVLLEQANALLYTPTLFGGDPTRALKVYNESIAILTKQGNNGCTWNYLNAYINLAYCQIKLKQYAAAQQTYNRLLAIAPDFKWVKQELIPDLQKKIAKGK